ncbi:MAG: hypothetical protein ACOCPE_00365, partial [Segatella copri]
LENRRTERYRGFESLSLRKSLLKEISEGFFFSIPPCHSPFLFTFSSKNQKKLPKYLVESKKYRTFAPA